MPAVRVTENATRTELAEALHHLCHAAKREIPKVGNQILPTPWDARHEAIDDLLTLWEMAQ